MRIFLISTFFFLTLIGTAQDFDSYIKRQDDKVKIPDLHQSLQLDEFKLLSREARMMDMFYAVAVPGYVHFKAKEPVYGYTLVGLRLVSYAGMLTSYYSTDTRLNRTLGLAETNDADMVRISDNYSINKYDLIFTLSLVTAISTYLYDWIHGKMILERKQEQIRYKYGIKFKLENSRKNLNTSSITTGLGVTLTF